ncbi:MAG: acetyl-CoA acetyltransferase [Dehalococcoidia bacterium]|nr:acetyl-CoA acetyltransferase [Dehalococcoidia bacterium]
MESLRDKIAIVGMGRTRTGELWDMEPRDMVIDACTEAFADAGIDPKEIQAVTFGSAFGGGPTTLAGALKLDLVPVTRIDNACATGGDTFRMACSLVASGMYDIVMAVGMDKQKDSGSTGQHSSSGPGTHVRPPSPPPASFAPFAVRYAHHYGLPLDELRRSLARIAVKNHRNGALNPKAMYQKEVTLQQVLDAPYIAYPLGIMDCCGVGDGAAAAIITRPDIAKHFRADYVMLKALGATTGYERGHLVNHDAVHFDENVRCAQITYPQMGIKDPMKEISMAEVHDAFTIVELISLEDVGLAPRGEGHRLVWDGLYDLEGPIPVNTDGGLKCNGHPIGATGLLQIYEVYKQCQAKAGPRQVKNMRLAMAHNQGGFGAQGVSCTIALFSPRD